MKKIGLLSDTHGWWDDKYATYFGGCDEIWHAGDIGAETLIRDLAAIKPLRAVYGNIDGYPLRQQYPKTAHFKIEDVNVMMTHIGGYPGRYDPSIRAELYHAKPQLFISGHSHILKVMYDKHLQCLHINPGAAGISGFQQVRTLVRFVIDKAEIKDLEVIELMKVRHS
ncbi:MAG: metallophosphatase family protein [Tannerella sp.]|jgi:putative phosphoesterase|nr:metallophosphatase family protein [Tannerella sp.]